MGRAVALAAAMLGLLLAWSGASVGADDPAMERFRAYYPKSWYPLLPPGYRQSPPTHKLDPSFAPPANAGERPAHLVIGDSISLCYFPYVRKELSGELAVHRIPQNGGGTKRGLQNMATYLEAGPFDLISFNWGLHDMAHWKNAAGETVRYGTGIEEYRKRLTVLAQKLKATGAKLLWVDTTPVLDGPRYFTADVARYNGVAREVMRELGIAAVDLVQSSHWRGAVEHQKDGFHLTAPTCQALGLALAAELRALR